MTRRVYSPDFKHEAGQLVVARGVSVAQASMVSSEASVTPVAGLKGLMTVAA